MSNTNNMLQLISHNVQPAAIDYNYSAVKAYVEKKAEEYKGLIVTDDNLKQSKQDRDDLASARVSIDEFRKEKKKEMSVNITLMENQCKELISIIENVEKPLQAGIDVYDNKKREKRRKQAEGFIQKEVDEMQLRPEFASKLVVKDFYMNLSGTQKEVKEDIHKEGMLLKEAQDKLDNNILTIKATVNAVNGTISAPFNVEEFIRMLDHYELQEIVNNINNRAEQVREAERKAKEAAEQRAIKEAKREGQEFVRRAFQAAQNIQEMGVNKPHIDQIPSVAQNISAPNIPIPGFAGMPDPQKQIWLLSLNIRTSVEKLQLLNAFLKDNDIEYKKVNLIKE